MLKLNSSCGAQVLIDLQEGVFSFAGAPHSVMDVVKRAAELLQSFRDALAPLFLMRVCWSADFADALPEDFHYGVEVRHPVFFAKQDEER